MQPLEGTRVLDLTRLAPGLHCTMILGDLGAEVIRAFAAECVSSALRAAPRSTSGAVSAPRASSARRRVCPGSSMLGYASERIGALRARGAIR